MGSGFKSQRSTVASFLHGGKVIILSWITRLKNWIVTLRLLDLLTVFSQVVNFLPQTKVFSSKLNDFIKP